MTDTLKIYKQLAAIMQEIEPIKKDSINKSGAFQFKYRSIDDVYNTLQPILAKNQVFMIPEVLSIERSERGTGKITIFTVTHVKFTLYTDDGSSISGIMAGEAMDNGDKSIAKTISIAAKYFLFNTFLIPTGDDPDAETYELKGNPIENKRIYTHQKNSQPLEQNAFYQTQIKSLENAATLNALKTVFEKGLKELKAENLSTDPFITAKNLRKAQLLGEANA